MLNNYKKNKKYIVLKDGNNYGVILGLIVILMVCVALFTSKMWLPDTRANISTKKGSELFFTMDTLKVIDYSIDHAKKIGELKIKETKTSENDKYKLSYKVTDDLGNKIGFNIITGDPLKDTEDSVMYTQSSIIQFDVYEDLYYISIEVAQKNTATQKISLDYREFKKANLLEKGKDYLINLEKEEVVLKNLKKDYEVVVSSKKDLEKEIKKVNGVDATIKKSELDLLIEKEISLKKEYTNQKQKVKELR